MNLFALCDTDFMSQLDSSMNEEAQGRLIAMKTLDRMHENTKEVRLALRKNC
jgi:hypothetical protein